MNKLLLILFPLYMTILFTPLVLNWMANGFLRELHERAQHSASTTYSESCPRVVIYFSGISSFFWLLVIILSYKKITESWATIIFSFLLLISTLLLYASLSYRTIILKNVIKVYRPFRRTRIYSLDQLKGYLPTDDMGVVYKTDGTVAFRDLLRFGLYNYFLKCNKIIINKTGDD